MNTGFLYYCSFLLVNSVIMGCNARFPDDPTANVCDVSCSGQTNVDMQSPVTEVQDVDGNSYRTVQIGDQVWMAENLRTTRFASGESIPLAESYEDWTRKSESSMCFYLGNPNDVRVHGILYNFKAVEDGRGICPCCWHVPSDEEWAELEVSLGLSPQDAEKFGARGFHGESMKADSTGVGKWNGTNLSDFSALPGGSRNILGGYSETGHGYWWTSTNHSYSAFYRALSTEDDAVFRYFASGKNGFSVRCIKD